MSRLGGGWRVFLVVVALAVAHETRAASPIPAFPRDGTVAVQDVPDSFPKLRRFLSGYRSLAGAKYHVAVVAFTDPLNREGPGFGDESGEYLARLVEKWRPSADAENAVIILVGLRNRDVRIHPFSRWAQLGWRNYEVVKTLEASQFASFARASDYESAVRALVLAIDAELNRRLRDQQNQEQRTRELIVETEGKNWVYETLAQQSRYDPPRARQVHERAVQGVAGVQSALAAGDPRKAFELAQAAASDADTAAKLFTELRQQELSLREKWREHSTRVATLEQVLASADFDTTGARLALKDATSALETADRLLREYVPAPAGAQLELAEKAILRAQSRLMSARTARERERMDRELRASARAFFIQLGLLLLGAILLWWLITQRWRSARRALEARGLIQQWEQLLQRVGDNLVKFEDEHALLLSQPELMARFDETSTGPVVEMAREVDNLFLSFEVAQRVLSAAEDMLNRAGRLRWLRERPYERALELLTVQEIVVRSEELTYRKPYLPKKDEVRMRPQQLLADIQASWERAVHLVAQLEERFRASWEKLDQLNQQLGELESLQLRLVELGIPLPPRAELTELERQVQATRDRAKTDPQGALEEAARLEQPLSRLRERTEHLIHAAAQVGKDVREAREEARAAVEQLRAEGFTVEEPGFEPNAMLAHIDKMSAEALRAVRNGNTEAAEKKAGEALESALELLELCDRLRRSREESLSHIPQVEQRCQALRERMPERRERLRGLRQAHADLALQPALDNVEEASAALGQVDRYLTEARACMAPGAQRYLGAEELIRRASEQLDAVDALFQEIETKAAELAQARHEVEKELAEEAWPFDAMKTLLMDAPCASTGTRAVYEKVMHRLCELRSAAQAERPNWRVLRELVMALQSETKAAVQRALAAYEAYQRRQQLPKSSSQLPAEKQPQAEKARMMLAAADAVLHDANTVYGAGVTADLSEAQRCFSVALAHLSRQDYALVIQAAEQVQQAIRRATDAAQAQAAAKLQLKWQAPAEPRELPDLWTATFSKDSSGSSPGRPSLGSSSGRSGFGKSHSRRGE